LVISMSLMELDISMMVKMKQKYLAGKNKKLRNIRMYVGTTNEIKQKARKNND